MIVGVVILLIGILYLLEIFNPSFQLNFDIIWPIVLIVISIYYIIKDEKLDFTKILFLFIGLWFLLVNTSLTFCSKKSLTSKVGDELRLLMLE